MYILRSIEALRVYHQSGFCGCFSTCEPVFAMLAHVGGCTASMFSFRYLAVFSMNFAAGTSYGVVKICLFLWGFSLQ